MPGTTPSDPFKGTESSGTHGLFVRPVAVAALFRPAEDPKPPTLPEKRRFSALSGDLRPCGEDFARRRQSWVTEPRNAPFGQALLRKTPRNSRELATNGASQKEKSAEKSESVSSDTEETEKAPIRVHEEKLSQNRASVEITAATPTHAISLSEKKAPSEDSPKKVYGLAKRDAPSETKAENAAGIEAPVTVARGAKPSRRESETSEPRAATALVSSGNNKTKVFGWRGETETDSVRKPKENIAASRISNETAANALAPKQCENRVRSREPENDAKLLEVVERAAAESKHLNALAQTNGSSDSSRVILKTSESLNDTTEVGGGDKAAEGNAVGKTSKMRWTLKPLDAKTTVCKRSETNDAKSLKEAIEGSGGVWASGTSLGKPMGVEGCRNETAKAPDSEGIIVCAASHSSNKTDPRPLGDSGVRKTSKIKWVLKTSEAKVVHKQPETNQSSESEVTLNRVGASSELKTSKGEETFKLEEKIKSCDLQAARKPPSVETSVSNEKSGAGASSKTLDSPIVDPNGVSGPASKIVTDSNSDRSKEVDPSGERGDKVDDFQKSQSPPKDFRVARRTSDVIAARIQNIFSNLSTPEKPPPLLSKKSKVLSKTSARSHPSSAAENKWTGSSGENADKAARNSAAEKNESGRVSDCRAFEPTKEVTKESPLVVVEEGDSRPTPAAHHRPSSKKENKSAGDKSCKMTGVPRRTVHPRETEPARADSPPTASTKSLGGEKSAPLGGKVPAKKEGTESSNESDRPSSFSTAPLKTVSEGAPEEQPMLRTEFSRAGGKIQKSASNRTSENSASPSPDARSSVNRAENSNSGASVETLSRIEVTQITTSPVPSPVPTVHVHFRTKSPQSSATKEENRRRVVVETSLIPEKGLPEDAPGSVQEALRAVESAQKYLGSPPPERGPSRDMPPNNARDECPPVDEGQSIREGVAPSALADPVQTPDVSPVPRSNGLFSASETDIPSRDPFSDDRCCSEARINVVDLEDWTRKFQRPQDPPRAPVRRRTRDSLPPALPLRSRFGSLRRVDDAPRYVPRSPSQSSLPQRYSYTEMLSKVCGMGLLADPPLPRSHSSLSSSSQVSELWSELSEEQSNATHTAEMLESETTERMRLEKEVQELQNRYSQVQLRSDKMEMEMMEARVYRSSEINGDLSEDEDAEANSSLYKQKYERAVRDMEIMKRRIQQQHEEEMEQKNMLKKASDKRLAEALEDVEEERQVANQWKRKAQKLGSELQDLRLMLEEQMARNGELEKKQRRFDAELSSAQEEIKKERILREKFSREKDQAMHEKYSLEQDLQSARLDVDTLHEKINQLNRELDELTLSSKGEEEVTQLKRAKQELERKSRDQEEELEELAAQVSMLEQAKLRLEMSLEKVRQEHRREASVREEEIEEIRASFSKKIKNLEAQLETEQDERHQLLKQKHELERRLYEIVDQPPPQDPEVERRLRRDLKRTKALLRDAQSMLEHTRDGQSGKTLIRQLKNQLEDSEFAKVAAVKARQAVEAELHDCQLQLEEATRVKNEVESRCLQLSREKSAIQTQLEEAEEEMAEVMKKYKAVVAQMSIDQKALSEQNQQIADLETEKQMLKDQLSEVSHKFEHLATQSEDTHKVHRLDGKVRDLESKLELEQTTRSRLEHQIGRLKEQNERVREECESLRNKENQAQEGVRRLQRQMRDLREDYSALQQKEAEAYRKQHELEMALENTETDLQVTKNDLRLACQRIQDLQNALEDDLDSGTDVPDDSGSDSDDSFELSVLRNQSVTPTQRCESAASNYSLASEGIRSRGSSFSHELSAFSSRNDAESKDHNGLSGVNAGNHLLALERDQAV